MKRAALLPLIPLMGLSSFAGTNEIHGPICSWHLDPLTTMNIQWIEGVDAAVDAGQWYLGEAGFGYGDDDDTTRLEMEQKHRVLYIRKEFDLRAVPTERPITVFGGWTATAKRADEGNPIEHQFTVAYDFRERKSTATLSGEGNEGSAFSKLELAGRSVEFEYELMLGEEKTTVRVKAEAPGGDDDQLLGTWQAMDDHGTPGESGEWTAKLTEPPAFGRRGRGGRGGRGRGQGGGGTGAGDANLKLVLRARYDDGFIAYLNGEEIVRANVGTGSGEGAKDIAGHDANEVEEFVIDEEELVKLLGRGRNVIAIEGHNNALDSSDFTLDPTFGYEAFGRYQDLVKDGDEWQYWLGSPQSDWKTARIEAVQPETIPKNASTFRLRYAKRGGELDQVVMAERRLFADTGNVIHSVLLKDLKPGTNYAFELERVGTTERLRRYFFRTAPETAAEPLAFVTGGDMYGTREKLDAMNAEAGRHEAAFALLGGDLAYANGRDANRWYDWVDSWARFAITPEDNCLPMIAVIGNHECSQNLNEVAERDRASFDPLQSAKFYYSLFPMPEGKSNFAVDFGDYMSVVCLDSYHTQTPKSQAVWLEETLRGRTHLPNLFVCYHRPAYGTLVKNDMEEIRQHWTPIIEKYGVDAVFENDHHVYKRTLPLKAGKLDPEGVAYLGDGAWGVETREIPWERARRLGYVVRGEKVNHLIKVTLEREFQRFDALTAGGLPIDNYLRMRPAATAGSTALR